MIAAPRDPHEEEQARLQENLFYTNLSSLQPKTNAKFWLNRYEVNDRLNSMLKRFFNAVHLALRIINSTMKTCMFSFRDITIMTATKAFKTLLNHPMVFTHFFTSGHTKLIAGNSIQGLHISSRSRSQSENTCDDQRATYISMKNAL